MTYLPLINPYYDPDKLGLSLVSFDEPDMSYEYNTLCFWATEDGLIYTAQDSGCSCPTPFEERHARETREEVLQTLERVGSLDQALATFDSWNSWGTDAWEGAKANLGPDERRRLEVWFKERFKQ